MNKLVKNELVKIFAKKSMIVMTVLIIVFVIGYNILNKKGQEASSSYSAYSNSYISYLEEELKSLDVNNPTDLNNYVETKSELDVAKLGNKYKDISWQSDVIQRFISPLITEINNYEYLEKDDKKLAETKKEYDEMIKALDNDWRYFASKELEEKNTSIDELNKMLEADKENEDIKNQLQNLNFQKKIIILRLEKDIPYGAETYKSQAMQNYETFMTNYNGYAQDKNITNEEKLEMNNYLQKANLYKYDIENGTEYQNTLTANYALQNSMSTYIVVVVLIVVIIAGVMISEEFNKGTIKLLLVRPYSRTKILLSKLIAVFITMIITTIFVTLLQLVVGGFVYGFGTYFMNVVQFDLVSNSIVVMNMFAYLGLIFVCKLPILILIGTLAFALSALSLNSPLAIALPIFGYMGSEMINLVALSYGWNWIKYFVTPNWDLSQYLFGGSPMFSNMSVEFSITICAIYFVIMLVASIITFKKRNIKNV